MECSCSHNHTKSIPGYAVSKSSTADWRISMFAGCVGSGSIAPGMRDSGGTIEASSGG